MTNITIYDYDFERIQNIMNKYDLSEHDVIQLLLDEIDETNEKQIFS